MSDIMILNTIFLIPETMFTYSISAKCCMREYDTILSIVLQSHTPEQASDNFIKADMNSDIRLQTAAIFFSDELLSETGYWLCVCHGWFHLHRLPLAARSWSEIYKMKNSSCPHRDSISRPSDWEAIALTARPRKPVLKPCLNLTRFSLCYFQSLW